MADAYLLIVSHSNTLKLFFLRGYLDCSGLQSKEGYRSDLRGVFQGQSHDGGCNAQPYARHLVLEAPRILSNSYE